MRNKINKKSEISRRDFILGTGAIAVGGVIGGGLLTGCAGKETVETVTKTVTAPTITKVVESTGATGGLAVKTKRLEVGKINISKVQSGAKTEIKSGVLTVNIPELKKLLMQDKRLGRVDIEVANPGESTRIVRIKSVFEARARTGARKGQFPFPGVMGGGTDAGEGSVVALKGLMVHVCNPSNNTITVSDKNPDITETGTMVQMDSPKEGECDASAYCAVAVSCYPLKDYPFTYRPDPWKKPKLDLETFGAALALAGMKTSAYLGRAGENLTPDSIEVLELPVLGGGIPKGMENLPKIVYLSVTETANSPWLSETFANTNPAVIYGENAYYIKSEIMHPNNYIDGAFTSPFSQSDCDYGYRNDPMVMELYRRHGKDLYFRGMIHHTLRVGYPYLDTGCRAVVEDIVNTLGANGVVVYKPGGGAPHAPIANICNMCEAQGVSAVVFRVDPTIHGQGIYDNIGNFGNIDPGGTPTVQHKDASKVFGFHYNIAAPNKAAATSSPLQPLFQRGGEKYTSKPLFMPLDHPYNGDPGFENSVTTKTVATRTADMVLAKIGKKPWTTEIDNSGVKPPVITPAPGIKDITKAKIAFICGGGLIRWGQMPQPFISSANRDGKFAQYDITGMNAMKPGEWEVHHGGHDPYWHTEDPERLFPLGVLRDLEKEGAYGSLHNTLYTWSSLSSRMVGSRLVGEGILALIKAAKVDAVITVPI
jgi:hypothetical protein